jgi:hypothetical protein
VKIFSRGVSSFSFYFYNTEKKEPIFCLLCFCPIMEQSKQASKTHATIEQFDACTSRFNYRDTSCSRFRAYTFDVLHDLGVCVCWHEDKDDEEGERVSVVPRGGRRYAYAVPVDALIRVTVCVPPPAFADLQDRAVATAMLLHERLGNDCSLSRLDEFTKDALLRMIVRPLSSNMHMTAVYKQSSGLEEVDEAVELTPRDPYELKWPLQLLANEAPLFWVLRDAQNKTVVELMFHRE